MPFRADLHLHGDVIDALAAGVDHGGDFCREDFRLKQRDIPMAPGGHLYAEIAGRAPVAPRCVREILCSELAGNLPGLRGFENVADLGGNELRFL